MQITLLPLASIRRDPNQPRKVFDPEKLQELANSIQAHGIQQPLRVQLVPAIFKIQEPELEHSDYWLLKLQGGIWTKVDAGDEKNFKKLHETWAGNFGGAGNSQDYEDGYQIIFGERRWRAAAMAGLDKLPCIVGDISEKDRFALQFIENNARENLSALEEAGAFAEQIAKRNAALKDGEPKFTPDLLAEELGIGRATVYGRLKLTRLHGPVREALMAGKISTSVAGSVAIIPDPKKQEELLKHITNEQHYQFPWSARDVEEYIEDEFVKQLDGAPFKLDEVYPSVHWFERVSAKMEEVQCAPACKGCPHRSGNMKEQFPELAKRPNVCTNPTCYGEKVKAHWAEEASREGAKGTKVLTAKEFKAAKGTLVKADENCTGYYGNSWEKELGKKAPEAVLVATEKGLEKFYPKDEAIAAAKAKGVKLPKENKPADRKKENQERAQQQQLRNRRQALAEQFVARLDSGIAKLKDKEAWDLVLQLTGDNAMSPFDKLAKKAKTAREKMVWQALGDSPWPVEYGTGEWDKELLAIWKDLGVDLASEDKAREPALPLTKSEPKQKELLHVPAKKRKAGRPPGAKNKKGIAK